MAEVTWSSRKHAGFPSVAERKWWIFVASVFELKEK